MEKTIKNYRYEMFGSLVRVYDYVANEDWTDIPEEDRAVSLEDLQNVNELIDLLDDALQEDLENE